MSKQKRGILGVKKDPKNQILFFTRNGEEWPSDDSEDSDYLPSDIEEDPKFSRKQTGSKQTSINRKVSRIESRPDDTGCVKLPPLPTEIWLQIFQDVVLVAGPLPFLCRAQKVCSRWRDLALHPSLWKKIDLSYGWIKAKEETLKQLCETRLTQCEEINLSGWTLSYSLRLVAEKCPSLQSINLSNCKKLTSDGVSALVDNCLHLREIDVSNTAITSVSLKDLITKRSSTMEKIDISCNSKLSAFSTVLYFIMKCPNLTELDISSIENTPTYIHIDVVAFQQSCPKLKVLRMGNNRFTCKNPLNTDLDEANAPGFPQLEEFLYPNLNGKSGLHNTLTWDLFYAILHKSPKIKVLDIRGRCNDCCAVLQHVPVNNVESLHIGTTSMCLDDPYLELVSKWRHSLTTLDLTRVQNVELGIEALTTGPDIPLEKIQLTGSNIEIEDLRSLLKKCPKLKYIQLESCRNLFRGIKRLYQTTEEIEKLRTKLNKLLQGNTSL